MSFSLSATPSSSIAYRPLAGRDLRIDLLRGCAVVAMLIDHLAGPSFLYLITDGGRFFTSAAEGFVFISGFVAAVVYGREVKVHGLRSACVRILRRAGLLYVLSVLLTLLVLPLSEHFGAGPCGGCPSAGIPLNDPQGLVWSIVTMRQTYYLVDIPLLYTRLMLLAPLGLALLTTGRTWLLTTLSVGVWAVCQVVADKLGPDWHVAGNATFHLPTWQLIFFGGMVLGYHHRQLSRLIRPAAYVRWLAAAGLGFAALILLQRVGLPGVSDAAMAWFFSKPEVGPGRLLASAIVFTFAFLAVHTLWVPVRRTVGWLLLPLGQHALWVYTAHVVLGLMIAGVEATIGNRLHGSGITNALIQTGAIGFAWLGIQHQVVFGALQRHGWVNRNATIDSSIRHPGLPRLQSIV